MAHPGHEVHAVDLEAADGQPASAARPRAGAGGGEPELVARRDLGDAAAMANLARANPALGRHLAATIRTGRYCAYTPDPRALLVWER